MLKIRARFAPSPTGYLHIGGLRTVLFNYLLAKSRNGKLILRVEDTDQKREVEGAIEQLVDILDWVGIKFDEGPDIGGKYGPYIQSQRLDIYKKYAEELLKIGGAYRCFCSPERLAEMRKEQQAKKLPPRYDRTCRDLSAKEVEERIKSGEKFVVRQKMPLEGEVVVYDELRGEIKFKAEDLEDHILIKSNGVPTYQFANVIDDHLMEITYVLRGEEWIASFPKNILLYQAFGWEPPRFIHLPLVLDKKGGKLSKRQGDVAVEDFKKNGYLPEALINFCALLGWHPKDDDEILSMERLIKEFNIKDMGISPAIFDIEKLDYLNGYYIRQKPLDELVELCMPYLEENLKKTREHPATPRFRGASENKKAGFIKKVISLEQERLKKLSEIGELTEFFFVDKLEYPEDLLAWKKLTVKQAKKNLEKICELLEKIPQDCWTNDSIEESIMSYLKSKELRVGEYLWPMRVALTGRKASPGPFDVAEVLGREESLKRIKRAIIK
jgi:glutamyl-tRNA synthetase